MRGADGCGVYDTTIPTHERAIANSAARAQASSLVARVVLLLQVLETQRAAGRTLFLATNSLFDYTNVVMNFLLLGKTGERARV